MVVRPQGAASTDGSLVLPPVGTHRLPPPPRGRGRAEARSRAPFVATSCRPPTGLVALLGHLYITFAAGPNLGDADDQGQRLGRGAGPAVQPVNPDGEPAEGRTSGSL